MWIKLLVKLVAYVITKKKYYLIYPNMFLLVCATYFLVRIIKSMKNNYLML